MGGSDIDAGRAACKSFLNYEINAPWIQAMRASAKPLVSFTYRVLPMLLKTAGQRWHNLLKLMVIDGTGELPWAPDRRRRQRQEGAQAPAQ